MRLASGAAVRATMAGHILGSANIDDRLGEIVLEPHQREGVARVLRLLEEQRGALLADEVGTGKTYIALGVLRAFDEALVVAPARLRDLWAAAADRTRIRFEFVSIESLSRRSPSTRAQVVLIDEAHYLRNAATRRFASAAALCGNARVLLMTATPVQNSLNDLRTVLSLFLGARAFALDQDELARFVVRRCAEAISMRRELRLPRLLPPRWISGVVDVDCLDRLLSLPRAVPPRDGDDGGILLTYTLARQWASSRAALVAALRRRLARGLAMHDALSAGRVPTRAELASWCYADGVQQLAFPELMADEEPRLDPALRDSVHQHLDAVRDLLAWLRASGDPDPVRARLIGELLDAHPGERIVAFSEYTETVATLYRALLSSRRVAMLTHAGGRVAGGPAPRAELLDRFAPGASTRTSASERIDLLLTTDVLSEGVNLQDASVVVHLDLAWNPARLQQRAGRLRRIGAARHHVSVYALAPPASAERLLELERRLREKTRIAARSIGVAGTILPGFASVAQTGSSAACEERIAARLRGWSVAAAIDGDEIGAAVRSDRAAAIACVRVGETHRLVSVLEDRISESRELIDELLAHADGVEAPVQPEQIDAVRVRVERWLRRRSITEVLDLPVRRTGQARRAILRRVATIAGRLPRHSRAAVAPLMHAARTAADAVLSAGAERVLDELASAPLEDRAWLKAVGEFAAIHSRRPGGATVRAILLLVPPTSSASSPDG